MRGEFDKRRLVTYESEAIALIAGYRVHGGSFALEREEQLDQASPGGLRWRPLRPVPGRKIALEMMRLAIDELARAEAALRLMRRVTVSAGSIPRNQYGAAHVP